MNQSRYQKARNKATGESSLAVELAKRNKDQTLEYLAGSINGLAQVLGMMADELVEIRAIVEKS